MGEPVALMLTSHTTHPKEFFTMTMKRTLRLRLLALLTVALTLFASMSLGGDCASG